MRQVQRKPKRKVEATAKDPLVETIIPISPAGRRGWKSLSDDELVEYAQKFIEENEIRNRCELQKVDCSFYQTLNNRNLIKRICFKKSRRNWSALSYDDIVEYAQKYIDKNSIKSRNGLQKAFSGLFNALYKRNLLSRLKFKGDERAWSKYNDDELVSYAQNYMDKIGIKSRKEFEEADSGLYCTLYKRKDGQGIRLLNRITFKKDERAWSRYNDDELVEYVQKFVDENDIKNRSGLQNTDPALYETLQRRKDDQGSNLINRVKFQKRRITRKKRFFTQKSDDELVKYAQKYIDENEIKRRTDLQRADGGLYNTLLRRKLLNRVFADFEKEKQREAVQQVVDGLQEFDAV